jgi:cytosine permease
MLTAWAGVRSRRSVALLAERSFGEHGARIFNVVNGAALLGWFAVEMGFIGQLLSNSFRLALGLNMPIIAGIIGGSVAIGVITIFGISVIARGPMIFVPFFRSLSASSGGRRSHTSLRPKSMGSRPCRSAPDLGRDRRLRPRSGDPAGL